jgi:hypothetical protein
MPSPTSVNSQHDASWRYFRSKFPYGDVNTNNFDQLLVNNSALATTGIISLCFGRPTTVVVAITANISATFSINQSWDGVNFFSDQTNNVVMTAGQTRVVSVIGAGFIQIVPTVAQTACTVRASGLY